MAALIAPEVEWRRFSLVGKGFVQFRQHKGFEDMSLHGMGGKLRRLPNPQKIAEQARIGEVDLGRLHLTLGHVRAGFRLTLHGSWDQIGVRPDLSAWSKAIANGYALSAVMGNDRFRDAAAQLYATGSFWCGAASITMPPGRRYAGLDLRRLWQAAQLVNSRDTAGTCKRQVPAIFYGRYPL
jgi:hypothetical protein